MARDRDEYIPERNHMQRYAPYDDDEEVPPPPRPQAPPSYAPNGYAQDEYPPRDNYPHRETYDRRYPPGGYETGSHVGSERSYRMNGPDDRERYEMDRYDRDRMYSPEPYPPSVVTGPIPVGSEYYYDDYEEDKPWHPKTTISKVKIMFIIYAVVFAFAATQIVMGIVFLYRCPVRDFIPEWNLITGMITVAVIALIALIHICEFCRLRVKTPHTDMGERGKTAQSVTQFHKMAWVLLTVIHLLAMTAGTGVMIDERPEFDLESDDFYNIAYEDYLSNNRRGDLQNAEIMNPDYCDPGIWIFTLIAVIVGWIYMVGLLCIWIYSFCVKMPVRVKKLQTADEMYIQKQASVKS